jgi:hypothetical protein
LGWAAAAFAVRLAAAAVFAGPIVFVDSAGISAAGAFASAVSSAAGSVPATPTVLERVRWQVSHVVIVRTSVPSCRSSTRKVRGRAQNEQKATSVVTLTWPGRLFTSDEGTGLLTLREQFAFL